MTIDEAIIRLKGMYGNGYTEQEQALDMAIQALSAKTTINPEETELKLISSDGDLISRQAVIDTIRGMDRNDHIDEYTENIIEHFEKLPSVKVSGDLISRTDLLNKIFQQAEGRNYDGQNMLDLPYVDLIKSMPSAEKTDSVLEDIKAEFISKYPKKKSGKPILDGFGCEFSLNDILAIIDKHISGKEKRVNELNIENDLIHRGNALNAIAYGKDKNEMQGNILNIPRAEKEIVKQVILSGDGYSNGELVYDFGECPNCGWNFEEGDKDWEEPYCCHCGQRLHWFDKESEEE